MKKTNVFNLLPENIGLWINCKNVIINSSYKL